MIENSNDTYEEIQKEKEEQQNDLLNQLKAEADTMGLTYHPLIGTKKLQEKINLQKEYAATENTSTAKPTKTVRKKTLEQLKAEYRVQQRKEATKLVRVNITCMNPNKKDWPGEIFSVSNAVVGTLKKFIPYSTAEGYHIPHMIYEQLKERKYQQFTKVKVPGRPETIKPQLVNEFAIEVLPPLTKGELRELADRQALNHSIDA